MKFKVNDKEIINYFKGTEMQKYLSELHSGKVSLSYKPQQIEFIPKQFKGTVKELLKKIDKKYREGLN